MAQNIYDQKHSEIYAEHLYNSKTYDEASFEYERLLSFKPGDPFYSERLLSCFIQLKEYRNGIIVYDDLREKDLLSDSVIITEMFLYMLLQEDEFQICERFFGDDLHQIEPELYDFYLCYLILKGECNYANEFANSNEFLSRNDTSHIYLTQDIINKCNPTDRKSPVIASLLSMVIPGSGKAYSDDFMNGASAFTTVTLFSWQAYRAVIMPGSNGIYAILFSSAAIIFYIGNIYGSYKSAIRKNSFEQEKYKEKILEILRQENGF